MSMATLLTAAYQTFGKNEKSIRHFHEQLSGVAKIVQQGGLNAKATGNSKIS